VGPLQTSIRCASPSQNTPGSLLSPNYLLCSTALRHEIFSSTSYCIILVRVDCDSSRQSHLFITHNSINRDSVYHCCLLVQYSDEKHDIVLPVGGGMDVMIWKQSIDKASVCHQLPKSTSCKMCSKFFPETSPAVKQAKSQMNSITFRFLSNFL
jgi:hypothetical protein